VLDFPVFFFRNFAQGAGPCAAEQCAWGPRVVNKVGGCLAGICSEPTTFNAVAEVAAVVAGLPAGRGVLAGYYATMHSSLGQPSARYVSRLLQTLALQPGVLGVMTYTAKSALQPCVGAPLFGDDGNGTDDAQLQYQLGCIVRDTYAAIAGLGAGAQPQPQPADAAAGSSWASIPTVLAGSFGAVGGALAFAAAGWAWRRQAGAAAGSARAEIYTALN
jgi:hypothetical protein